MTGNHTFDFSKQPGMGKQEDRIAKRFFIIALVIAIIMLLITIYIKLTGEK